MRVLVTGAKGQLGSDLLCELSNRNIDAIGIDIDDLDITVSGNYKIIKNVQDNDKEVIEIPVQVKNTESTENSFSIGYVTIYDKDGKELREMGSIYRDKSFENSPKIAKGEMTIKNIYVPYVGNGTYRIVFKTFYEEKEMKIDIKK